MNRVSEIVDIEITLIEEEMQRLGRHVIRTETVRERALRHIYFDGENEETKYCTRIGFGQVIQSRLQTRGYRSIREGRFVNAAKCDSIPYLTELLRHAKLTADEKAAVAKRISVLRHTKMTGQEVFDTSGLDLEIIIPPNEKEFTEMVEADAV